MYVLKTFLTNTFTGKFRSKSVIEALLDLLTDSDKNVCAVAAISLARTGASGPRVSNGFQHVFYYLMLELDYRL